MAQSRWGMTMESNLEQMYAIYEMYCRARAEMGEAPLPFQDFCWLEAAA